MSTISYYINRYSNELTLANKNNWQFDQNFKLVTSCTNPLSSVQVLSNMKDSLEGAEVYHSNKESLIKFISIATEFANKSSKTEVKRAIVLVNSISTLVQKKTRHVWSCFQGPPSKKINDIFDKKIEEMEEKDFLLLIDIANLIANQRSKHQNFYKVAAVIEGVNYIRSQSKGLYIQLNEDDTWTPFIEFTMPTDLSDIQFLIFIEFYVRNRPQNIYKDVEFIKKVIQTKLESKDLGFKNYLEQFISLYKISILCRQWDEVKNNKIEINNLNELLEQKVDVLSFYSRELFHEPAEYKHLKNQNLRVNPFINNHFEFEKISKELFVYQDDTNSEFDRWYSTIYKKIISYQKLHNRTDKPLFDSVQFNSLKHFITKDDVLNSVNDEILSLENEVKKAHTIRLKAEAVHKEQEKAKKEKTSNPKRNQKKSVNTKKQDLSPSRPDEEILSPAQDLQISKSEEINAPVNVNPPILEVDSLKEREFVKNQEVKQTDQSIITIPSIIQTIQRPLADLLKESSPFNVDKRITSWFLPDHNNLILNEDSLFIHNFAWAANDILWKFGMQYPRAHENGYFQPAMAMLCKVYHQNYPNPELFLITMTFTEDLGQKMPDSNLKYLPSWTCYHRTLTKRQQGEEMIKDYVANGKHQFIDFPALPSQRVHVDLDEDLKNKVYPDGSYIQSVQGEVIVIRDPKNDGDKTPCRMHLFIVR